MSAGFLAGWPSDVVQQSHNGGAGLPVLLITRNCCSYLNLGEATELVVVATLDASIVRLRRKACTGCFELTLPGYLIFSAVDHGGRQTAFRKRMCFGRLRGQKEQPRGNIGVPCVPGGCHGAAHRMTADNPFADVRELVHDFTRPVDIEYR